jgi:hypothetical protein
MWINDHLINLSAVNDHVHGIVAALTHLELSISKVAKYSKLAVIFLMTTRDKQGTIVGIRNQNKFVEWR